MPNSIDRTNDRVHRDLTLRSGVGTRFSSVPQRLGWRRTVNPVPGPAGLGYHDRRAQPDIVSRSAQFGTTGKIRPVTTTSINPVHMRTQPVSHADRDRSHPPGCPTIRWLAPRIGHDSPQREETGRQIGRDCGTLASCTGGQHQDRLEHDRHCVVRSRELFARYEPDAKAALLQHRFLHRCDGDASTQPRRTAVVNTLPRQAVR